MAVNRARAYESGAGRSKTSQCGNRLVTAGLTPRTAVIEVGRQGRHGRDDPSSYRSGPIHLSGRSGRIAVAGRAAKDCGGTGGRGRGNRRRRAEGDRRPGGGRIHRRCPGRRGSATRRVGEGWGRTVRTSLVPAN